MSKQSYDHPNVIVFPPLIPIVTIAMGITLQWLRPLALLAHVDLAWRVVTGVALLVAGVLFASTGRYALMRRGTNVNPLRPATALVTEGVFGWTRNPMYVGVSFAVIGIALVFAVDWLLLLFVASLVLLHYGVVLREEQYLEHKFGDGYRCYKSDVARYLRPIKPRVVSSSTTGS
jgi:protein-S-isoprenylcysteine O-methyltransferase Ste14